MANEEAEEHKRKGNDAFKEKKWDEAIKHYNKAITLDPSNAAYYSNRSAAWSFKGSHESALADANKCIEKDPKFVKGYARKGKALFDLKRWDDAEEAYKKGLTVEASNDACTRGLADIATARRGGASSGSSSSSSGGGSQWSQYSSVASKVFERLKSGGRMQTYLIMFAAYYGFQFIMGRGKGAPADTAAVSSGADLEVTNLGLPLRGFGNVGGSWLSYLHGQSGDKTASSLVLLHSTAASAEAEFGSILPRLLQAGAPPSGSGLRVLAPDRPCHGYSPCLQSSSSDWLESFLQMHRAYLKAPKPKQLGIAASGREAAAEALAVARQQPEVKFLFFLNPQKAGPSLPAGDGPSVKSWLSKQASTIQEAADAARWAAATAADSVSSTPELKTSGLSKDLRAILIYSTGEEKDEELQGNLENAGVSVEVRSVASGLGGLEEEVIQAFGLSEE